VAAGAPRELTLRAVMVGCGIGALLAAGNVYTSIKTGFIDGGSISAAVLGFTFFAVFRRLSRAPYTAAENNITQTTAASAAVMSFVLGAGGPLSALALLGKSYPAWQLLLWTMSLGLLGIFIATLLRNKLIVVEDLPFPTGAATAEIIETIHTTRESALYRARLLTFAGLAAMYVAWFRDGPWSLVPQLYVPAITIAGLSAASLSLGVSWSPLLASTGVLMGLRGAASMLVGAGLAWVVVAPRLVHGGLVPAEYSALVGWLVWPALGVMLPSTFLPLLFDWRSTWRSFRDLSAVVRIRNRGARSGEAPVPLQKTVLLVCLVVLVVLGRVTFGLHPLLTLVALLISVALAAVCARAAGETDLAPVGQVGMAMQLGFGGSSTTSSLVAGGIAQGTASQVAQMMWAFKAGRRLGASPRAQVIAQVVGAIMGALVVVPVYLVIIQAYQLGSEAMPAASAVSWKATAEAVHGGLASLPRHGPLAAGIGVALGTALTLLGRTRLQRFVPSPTAMGIAVLLPASLTITIFLGAAIAALVQRRWPQVNDTALSSVAAGGIAGESIMGVVVAILIAFGLI
jgi:putative OPT family oligopeptide transporter